MSKPAKVEILSPDPDAELRPWFEPRARADAMRQGQSKAERQRWAVYFERFGCNRCGRKDQPHGSLGFCKTCRNLIGSRIRTITRQIERGEG